MDGPQAPPSSPPAAAAAAMNHRSEVPSKISANPFQMTGPSEKPKSTNASGNKPMGGYYLNVAQKGKLILPTALWILLVVAGICFLTLLASLSRTLGTLDTLVELEQERTELLQRQASRAGFSEQSSLGPHNQRHKHHFMHKHHRKQQSSDRQKTTSEPLSPANNGKKFATSSEQLPANFFDQQFSDEQPGLLSRLLSPGFSPSWFNMPSWTSLEPERFRHETNRQGGNGPDMIIASIETDDPGNAVPPMISSMVGQLLSGESGLFGASKPVKANNPDSTKFSANIDNLSININPFEEARREEKKRPVFSHGDGLEQSVDNLISNLVVSREGDKHLHQAPPALNVGPLAPLSGIAPPHHLANHLVIPSQDPFMAMLYGEPIFGRRRPHLSRREPYELGLSPLVPLGGQSEHKKSSKDELDNQQQWHALSSEMADSILQSLLHPTPTTPNRDLDSKYRNEDPLVVIDGKPLNPSGGKKLMPDIFGPEGASKQANIGSESPLEQIGNLLNQVMSTTAGLGDQSITSKPGFEAPSSSAYPNPDEPQQLTMTIVPSPSSAPSPSTLESSTNASAELSTSNMNSSESAEQVPTKAMEDPTALLKDVMNLFTLPQFSGSSTPSGGSSAGGSSVQSGSGVDTTTLTTSTPSEFTTTMGPSSSITTPTISTEGPTSLSGSTIIVKEAENLDSKLKSFMGFSENDQLELKVNLTTEQTTTTTSPKTASLETQPTTISNFATGLGGAPMIQPVSNDDVAAVSALDLTPFATKDKKQVDAMGLKPSSSTESTDKPLSIEPVVKNQTAPTIRPHDASEKPLKTFLQRADDFFEKSLKSLKQMF